MDFTKKDRKKKDKSSKKRKGGDEEEDSDDDEPFLEPPTKRGRKGRKEWVIYAILLHFELNVIQNCTRNWMFIHTI